LDPIHHHTSVGSHPPGDANDGGSSEKASLAGFFANVNYIGAYLFHIFARKARDSEIYGLDAWVPRDERRVFTAGEFEIYVNAFFLYICRQKYIFNELVRTAYSHVALTISYNVLCVHS
jgi:hypothetical protein